MMNGSSWSTIEDCLEFDEGKHDLFVGIEHRLPGEWNTMDQQGYKKAVDDAKATMEVDEVGWCASGGVEVAVANHSAAVASTMSIEENEGKC